MLTFLHLRSYQDGTGGSDNLVILRVRIGMGVWQQSLQVKYCMMQL
jgi:hypothetical protein